MKSHLISGIIIFFLLTETACSQFNQVVLTGLKEDNKNLIETSSGTEKEFFPIMLSGFERDLENRSDHPDWSKGWGFNIVQTWHGIHFDRNDPDNKAGKDTVLKTANANNIFVAFNQTIHGSKAGNAKLLTLYDEPIHMGYSSEDLADRKNFLVSRVKDASDTDEFLWFVNFAVRPFFVRYDSLGFQDNIQEILNSKIPYSYDGKISTMSYDEAISHADIIGFDFYPWGHNRKEKPHLRKYSFQSNYINTSVGEFTGLLKKHYPDKPVWAHIQTQPFHPYAISEKYNDPGEKYYITADIIRHLTFSAIINGADGIVFFGQNQYRYPKSLDGGMLHAYEDSLWKFTLEQCYELNMLQSTEFNSILLEDNIMQSYSKEDLVEYCYKQVRNSSSQFYLFVTSSSSDELSVDITILPEYKIDGNPPVIIGKYSGAPAYRGNGKSTINFLNENPVVSVSDDGRSFAAKLKAYGTNIYYLVLEED
jgi:hypothetical protein